MCITIPCSRQQVTLVRNQLDYYHSVTFTVVWFSGPELYLIPQNEVQEYLAKNIKRHVWRKTSPDPETTQSSDPMVQATKGFHLINARPSVYWQDYIAMRLAFERRLATGLEDYSGREMPSYLRQIRSAVEKVLIQTDLDDGQQNTLFDCVVPIQTYRSDEDENGESEGYEVSRHEDIPLDRGTHIIVVHLSVDGGTRIL